MLASQLFLSFFLFLFFNGEALVLSVDPSIQNPLFFDSQLFHNIKNKYYNTIYILKNYNI